MKSLYLYFKLLFSDDEQLMRKWNQLSDGKVSEKYRQAVAKKLQKREYRYDGANWVKSSTSSGRGLSYLFHKSRKG